MQEAKQIISKRKYEKNQEGMAILKKQLQDLDVEIDAVKMPIIDIFKDTLLKQRENAFKRTMKGSIERDIKEHSSLPRVMKEIEKQKQFKEMLNKKKEAAFTKVRAAVAFKRAGILKLKNSS